MMMRKSLSQRPVLALAIAVLITACTHPAGEHYRPTFANAAGNKRVFIFGAPSLAYFETTNLVIKYLNAHLDSVQVRTVACTSLEDYEDKLRRGYFDFTVINGPQLLTATQHGYTIVGRIADEYRAVIFSNRDSGIQTLADCRDRTIALTANRVLAGSVMPLMWLYEKGVDVGGLKKLYSPSYESVLLDVCLGKCAMGAVWTTSYENFRRKRPDLASRLEEKWTTPSMASSAILFKNGANQQVAGRIAALLFQLKSDEAGRQALERVGIGSFIAADSTAYTPLKRFLRKYDSLIH
jgi:phosphonate transport system substrate-binding protein